MHCKSKKGSLFVEAAMIYPLVIITIMLIVGHAYRSCDAVSEQAKKHIESRRSTMDQGRINKGESEFVRRIDFMLEGLK